MRDGLNATERLLVDPEKLTTAWMASIFSIDYFQPSLDGKYVAYGISPGGSEESVLHVVESANGKPLTDIIDRAEFGQPSWLPDHSFFYTRSQKLGPDSPATAKYQKLRCYRHTLGVDSDKEELVFGFQVSSAVNVTEDDFPSVAYSPGAPNYLIGVVVHGVKREIDLYTTAFQGEIGAKNSLEKSGR